MPDVAELRVLRPTDLTFPAGLPGLKGAHRFHLEPIGDPANPNPFGRLVALDPVELSDGSVAETRLIVAAPGLLWPEYTVAVDDDTAALLELESASDAGALVVVTLGKTIEDSSANLLAPIVLNVAKLLAAQIVPADIDNGPWSMKTPLPIASPAITGR